MLSVSRLLALSRLMRLWPTESKDRRFSLPPNLAIVAYWGVKAKQAFAPIAGKSDKNLAIRGGSDRPGQIEANFAAIARRRNS
jgi:hypothetical protein